MAEFETSFTLPIWLNENVGIYHFETDKGVITSGIRQVYCGYSYLSNLSGSKASRCDYSRYQTSVLGIHTLFNISEY
jgi:hypothetical protein